MGAVKGQPARLGDERFVRRSPRHADRAQRRRVKDAQGAIVVGLDGSAAVLPRLKVGIALARALDRPCRRWPSTIRTCTTRCSTASWGCSTRRRRRSSVQGGRSSSHEEIIDTGLAKIYQSHLEIARSSPPTRVCAFDFSPIFFLCFSIFFFSFLFFYFTLLDGKCSRRC